MGRVRVQRDQRTANRYRNMNSIRNGILTGALGVALLLPGAALAQGRDTANQKPTPEQIREQVRQRLQDILEKNKERREQRREQIKERLGGRVGEVLRNDDELKALRKEFAEARDEILEGLKDLRAAWKDASEGDRADLRKQFAELRQEWLEAQKEHAAEVRARLHELKEEFKNREFSKPVEAGAQEAGPRG